MNVLVLWAQQKDKEEAILEAMLDLVGEGAFTMHRLSLLAKRSGASVDVIYHHCYAIRRSL